MESRDVTLLINPGVTYPRLAPYNPPIAYPEIKANGLLSSTDSLDNTNQVYESVRRLLFLAGLDRENYGTEAWNPLKDFVRKGDRVVIKPNLVLHEPPHLLGTNSLTTHGSIVRVLLDYALIALHGSGRISIADAPLQEANFTHIIKSSGLTQIVEHFRQRFEVEIELLDLRLVRSTADSIGFFEERQSALSGDPRGYVVVDLGALSNLCPIALPKTCFSVTNYDRQPVQSHHAHTRHEYMVSKTVLEADSFINVPKLKTHSKAGMTCSLKNIVGIVGHKEWLPHFRLGAPAAGGDEYPFDGLLFRISSQTRHRFQGKSRSAWLISRLLWRAYKNLEMLLPLNRKTSREVSAMSDGAWYGNDTLWRTIMDLNLILFFARPDGALDLNSPSRRYLSLVDGIVCGQGDGPLNPDPKIASLLCLGTDPIRIDSLLAWIMGFEPQKIPLLSPARWKNKRAVHFSDFDGDLYKSINLVQEGCSKGLNLGFTPAPGWAKHIERQ